MLAILLFLFIVVPFVELYILIELGSRIGAVPTLGIVVLTGMVGAALAKQQGLGVFYRIRTELSYGQMPGDVIFDGVMVLIGAVLLITPGIFTDITGFLLLIPVTRATFKKYFKKWIRAKIQSGQIVYHTRDNYHMKDI